MGIVWPNGTRTEPKRSDGYGPRTPIKTPEGWTRPFHVGTDHTGIGTIKSIGDGTVIEAGWSSWAGWQVLVYLGVIDGVRTWVRYCHLRSASKLKRGQKIARGQTIGTEGSTGQSMGVHLHWEIYRGRIDRGAGKNPGSTIDPRPFIRAHLAQKVQRRRHSMIGIRCDDAYGKGQRGWALVTGGFWLESKTSADMKVFKKQLGMTESFLPVTKERWEEVKAASGGGR